MMNMRETDSLYYKEWRAFIMLKRVSVKPILELLANGISVRSIASVLHVSRHTISKFFKVADSHSIS